MGGKPGKDTTTFAPGSAAPKKRMCSASEAPVVTITSSGETPCMEAMPARSASLPPATP